MAIPREGGKYKKEILEKQLATMTQKEVAKLYNTSQQYIAIKAKQFGINTDYGRITNSVEFTQEMRDLVFGSLLGDLHLQKIEGVNRYAYIRAEQGLKQKDYLYFKYEILKDICKSAPKKYSNRSYYFNTKGHKELNRYYEMFYGTGKKVLPKEFEKEITNKALLYWILDDGTKSGTSFEITADGFSIEDCERVIEVLKRKFDYNVRLRIRNGKGHSLRFSSDSAIKFLESVKGSIPQSMFYKFDKVKLPCPCNDYVVASSINEDEDIG